MGWEKQGDKQERQSPAIRCPKEEAPRPCSKRPNSDNNCWTSTSSQLVASWEQWVYEGRKLSKENSSYKPGGGNINFMRKINDICNGANNIFVSVRIGAVSSFPRDQKK